MQDVRSLSDGSPFADAVQIANRSQQLVAVGVNCCPPQLVEPLLESARGLLRPELSWVVYPNSGEEWDSEQGWVCLLKDVHPSGMSQVVFCFVFPPSPQWLLYFNSWHGAEAETESSPLIEMSRGWMKQGAELIGKLNDFLLSTFAEFFPLMKSARLSTRRLLQNQPSSYSQVTPPPKRNL